MLKVTELNTIKGKYLHKPQTISTGYNYNILKLNSELCSNHFTKDSQFGINLEQEYLKLDIFCENLEQGLLELESQLKLHQHLTMLFVQHIGKQGQDWNSDTYKYGNLIRIIFIGGL